MKDISILFVCLFVLGAFFMDGCSETSGSSRSRSSNSDATVEAAQEAAIVMIFLEQFKSDFNAYDSAARLVGHFRSAQPVQHPRNGKFGWQVSMGEAVNWAGGWMQPNSYKMLRGAVNHNKHIWMESDGFGFEVVD